MKIPRIVSVAAAFSLLAVPSCWAKSLQTTNDDWQIISPVFYLWLFQTDGNLTLKGKSHNTDLSIGDVLDKQETAIQLYLEANKGDWGGCIEPTYLSFSSRTKSAGVKYDNNVDILLVDAAGQYRFWHTTDPNPMSLYAMLGLRYWNYDIESDGRGTGAPDLNANLDIIDPIMGLRFRMDVSDKFHLGARGDIGGFGLTDKQSHFTWQTWLLMKYDFTKYFSTFVGYRALGLNYEEGHGIDNKGVDVVFSGPVIGLDFDIFGWLADRKK
jgi:hypothetical protein